jgi:leucyl aminopeptidase
MTATLTLQFSKALNEIEFPALVLAGSAESGDTIAMSTAAETVDHLLDGALSRAAEESQFKAKAGASLVVRGAAGTAVLIGSGETITAGKEAETLGGHVFAALGKAGVKSATLYLDADAEVIADIAHGAHLASYVFKHYFTKGDQAEVKSLQLTIASAEAKAAEAAYESRAQLAEGVFLARDLVTEPANKLYPESYAERLQPLSETGLKITVLDEDAMRKEGMHLLLSVGQGSRRASRMVVMEWQGGAKDEAPIALVGKGVCFDTGGISIKPAAGMEDMKWDMGGSAAVVGAMRALAGRKVKRNVVGLVGLVENMPDGEATRPGDVVTSMSGQTVEIINTDAEGRLVLADVLTYANKYYKPAKMINLATLTGAILVSLGKEYAGLFSNNDELSQAIMTAGNATNEKSWRMPMGKEYDDMLKSHIADMKNIGGRLAGSITAACFLERFVEGVPWAHLDIAGMAWSDKSTPTVPKGGTGYGVKMLTNLIETGL